MAEPAGWAADVGLLDALHIARSGLGAASTGIRVTSQNVANASTPGYTRRDVEQSTSLPIRHNGVWLGTGVHVDRVGRAFDPLLFGRVVATTANATASASQHGAMASLERLFETSSGTGLRSAVDGIFDALGRATSDPSDPGYRLEVVSAATTFARIVNGVGDGLAAGIQERDDAIAARIGLVNADLAEIAAANAKLVAAGGSRAAGDVADRRDEAIHRLADAIGATVHFEGDGTATVFLGGHAAVSGTNARTVSVDAGSPPSISLSVDAGSIDLTPYVGGAVAGERDAREALVSWLADADTLAVGLANALNAQNAAGFTPSGAPGGPIFTGTSAATLAAGITPDGLAFAGSAAALPGDGDNLRLMLAVESSPLFAGATAGGYTSQLVSRVGSETSLVATQAHTAEAMAADADALWANLSSVDLDEEAVMLIQFQTAYQAAAKVIQATDEMLAALMQIVR